MTEEEKKEFEEFLEWKRSKAAQAEQEKEQNQTPPPPPPTQNVSSNPSNSDKASTQKNSPNGCLIVILILVVVLLIWGISKCSTQRDYADSSINIEDIDSLSIDDDFSNDTLDISYQSAPIDTAARIETLKNTIKIKSAYLSSPNSAGGVDAIVYYVNKSKKTIKYFDWEGSAINAVGDEVACDIRNTYYFQGRDTGPIKPGKTGGGTWDCAWYNWTAKKLKINHINIIYMDGTTETISESEIKYVR